MSLPERPSQTVEGRPWPELAHHLVPAGLSVEHVTDGDGVVAAKGVLLDVLDVV
jgi:hypothetical protein